MLSTLIDLHSVKLNLLSPMLSPNSCARYLKLGSSTRRHSVIGCLGYEHANPGHYHTVETSEIGVGTSTCDNNENENNTCPICFDCFDCFDSQSEFGRIPKKNIATTACGHTFCLSCLLKNIHMSNLCPLCRAPIETDVKRVLKPLSYSEGIQLLNHELNGLQIYDDVEQYVQNALEISTQPNTNGQNVQDVVDSLVNMVTNFGFNLLFDAALHASGEEQHMDQEWIIQMYNDGESSESNSDSSINDSESDSDYSGESDSTGGDSADDDDSQDDESEKKVLIILPEVPESML